MGRKMYHLAENSRPLDTGRTLAADEMAMFVQPGATVDGEYDAAGFVTDGMTWNSGNTLTAPALGRVIFFGGADINVYAGTFLSATATNATTVVSTVPFKADLVLVVGTNSTTLDSLGSSSVMCVGAAIQIADDVF